MFEPLEGRHLLTTLTVNTLIDENDGIAMGSVSLRDAVAAAASNDVINFSVAGTINLTSVDAGHILINKNVTIQGPGASLLTIRAYDPDVDGADDSDGRRIFLVSDSNNTLLDVTISGLTLTNGDPLVTDENLGGGAIYNQENLTVNGCVMSGNFAPNGGAIYSSSGNLTVTDCTITNNTAGDGGGILIEGGAATLTHGKISNNNATNSGGGILSRGQAVNLTVAESTVSGNNAVEAGGGIYLYQSTLALSASTVSGNSSDSNNDQVGSGGGIYNLGGGFNITNSTISGNAAGDDGGGIFSNTGHSTSINHSTITANSITNHTSNTGGGVRSITAVSLNHALVAGNLKGSTREDVAGVFDAFYSLVGDRRLATVNNLGGSLLGTTAAPINPLLGPLTNNGGLTLTHALLTNSPAIDAGLATAAAGVNGIPLYDQRGAPFLRITDGNGINGARIDIGAYELSLSSPVSSGDYSGNGTVDAADYVLWRNALGSTVPPGTSADGDGNGTVNSADYTVWRAHFGSSAAVGSDVATALASNQTQLATADSRLRLAEIYLADALPGIISAEAERPIMLPVAYLTQSAGPDAAGLVLIGEQSMLATPHGSAATFDANAISDEYYETTVETTIDEAQVKMLGDDPSFALH